MQKFAMSFIHGARRWETQREIAKPKSSPRQLTVIGGWILRGRLILRLHLLELASRLRRPTAPIGSTRQHDRIGRAIVDVGEMLKRSARIIEKA